MFKNILNKIYKIFKTIIGFLGRKSGSIAKVGGILVILAAISMFVFIYLLEREYKDYKTNLYGELSVLLRMAEQDNGKSERVINALKNLQKKNPELGEVLITNNKGDVINAYLAAGQEKSMFSDFKKVMVYSDLGGFSYIYDEKGKLRDVFWGNVGKKTLREMQNTYNDNSSGVEWNNAALFPRTPSGLESLCSGKAFIDQNGYITSNEPFEDVSKYNLYPGFDLIAIKTETNKFYLYTFKMSRIGLGRAIINDYYSANFMINPLGVLDELSIWTEFKNNSFRFIRLEFLRDISFVITILGLIIAWLFMTVWVFVDARARKMKVLPWTVLILFTNIAGLIVYHVVRPRSIKVD